MPTAAVASTTNERYTIDSGAFRHLTKRRAGERVSQGPTTEVCTANGITSTQGTVERFVGGLGSSVDFETLKDTPNLLCMAELCRDRGFAFSWDGFAEVPTFKSPEGAPIPIQVDFNVPTIAGSAMAAANVEKNQASRQQSPSPKTAVE